ncbi:hypothetical protein [Vibrio aerogenes]|uniref:hypothetical protein n=1 Tax=Vibrio aerogenes TaxID=92172 RepID=UPI001114B352|nr:hypothetical protein [Vibrio aerogenes]
MSIHGYQHSQPLVLQSQLLNRLVSFFGQNPLCLKQKRSVMCSSNQQKTTECSLLRALSSPSISGQQT